jgi:CDP-diacylglycerol--serine O-phosphatidyltransferase
MAATTILFCHKFGIEGKINPIFILVLLYVLSFLMVSTIKYNSFKKPELFKKMNFNVLVAVILILIFIAAQPSIALFFLGLAYTVSGPISTVRHHRKIKPKVAGYNGANEHGSSPFSHNINKNSDIR